MHLFTYFILSFFRGGGRRGEGNINKAHYGLCAITAITAKTMLMHFLGEGDGRVKQERIMHGQSESGE